MHCLLLLANFAMAAGNFYRQAIWCIISFGIGYYCANTVSLSFGALAINDVLAAAVTVVFCEVSPNTYVFHDLCESNIATTL